MVVGVGRTVFAALFCVLSCVKVIFVLSVIVVVVVVF